ncbi:HAMP domain-containing histidine kinase [Saccharopolyspora kobensis]|uniref:HAMP domain-containing histidine kinase n=1 Tax=Saccharopolyspora kobensis TaxID=146035 RepID=UPI0011612255|nr:HAMP domain-containing histidine kinase [Saccharopolyspora kobensis]
MGSSVLKIRAGSRSDVHRLHDIQAEVFASGDEDRLLQVLRNLLSNPQQHTPTGTHQLPWRFARYPATGSSCPSPTTGPAWTRPAAR